MKNIFIALLLLGVHFLSAQDSIRKSPVISPTTKFGLALSGGGAKGFAHLGILKIIDSLGIKVDYITGTSMGGILGGLYGMGYSGEQLKDVVYKTNWKRVLSNKIPYNKVNINEKDEYNKYLIEFPIIKGKPSLPESYIEGQYMSEVLNTLTFPAKHINDFSKLPIPVELTSSDIVDGGLIMQKKGSLPLAIRATLAIPAAFTPVYIDGKLLVDGGLDRNFPVQEVKDMGADYIIGGYTGFRLFTKEEIENPMKMIYQTHAIRSVQDFNQQKKMSDILVDFVTPLNDYTTKDFKKYKEIIKIGEEEAKKSLPEFIRLAEEQRKQGIIYDHKLLEEVKKPTVKFTYSEDNGTPINNTSEIESIKKLMDLDEGLYYDAKTVNEAIDRVFGMREYEKVYYTYTDTPEGLIMNIFVKRSRPSNIKLALHYDNEQSVGIILNYTYRNYAQKKLRALMTLDISERFKARVHIQKFLDNEYRWSVSGEGKISFLKSNDLYLKNLDFAFVDTDDDINLFLSSHNYIYRDINANSAINYTIDPNSMASFGIQFNAEHLSRSKDKTLITSELLGGNIFSHTNFNFFLQFKQNNLNSRYYATSGNNLKIITKYYFGDKYSLGLTPHESQLDYYFNPAYYTIPKNLVSLIINENFVFTVNNKLSIKANAYLGTHFSTTKIDTENSSPYLFMNQKYDLGGSEYNFEGTYPEFNGFRQRELPTNSVAKTGLELQYNIFNKFYISPSLHFATISDNLSPFKESHNIVGYGVNFGYESLLGPINFNVSKNNFDPIDVWRAYFSIGFKF
ncbi:patatin-like phospholipase family protein [Chryseobacterium potabilaquae]|uniref:Putative NTE family protein n=1 Tax=Chryseobacterium potabilaquae TaxID=2675057 RepID=A0A6N4X5P3_9FLAO|nr:patatin-like phospholipase family protein [Chryseobacterium potabilaquae]CAA7196253.1 putative NTE family protein [Chryseobacterium potabilaquae]